MFPIGDENQGQRLTPVVCHGLIVVNVLVFLYQLTLSDTFADPALTRFIADWGAVPREIMDGRTLHTLVTSMFLHGGWLHIVGNMLFLVSFRKSGGGVMTGAQESRRPPGAGSWPAR